MKRGGIEMFCSNCGAKLVDGAPFCHQCGAKIIINAEPVTTNQPEQQSQGLDRKALEIYLNDVLALECIVNKHNEKIADYRSKISRINSSNYFEEHKMGKGTVYFHYDGQKFYVLTDRYGSVCGSTLTDSVWRPFGYIDANREKWFDFVKPNLHFFEKGAAQLEMRDRYLELKAKFKEDAPIAFQQNAEQMSKFSEQQDAVNKEKDEANAILDKMYQLNIIPEQFRHNLYAIYYLHNFITTSELSLETALLHLDLDEIKAKLDTIIEQQREIIVNQAVEMAQNKALFEQNQQQLRKLSEIETNTYYAAQYSEIAADNAEACAWIGIANYFKD